MCPVPPAHAGGIRPEALTSAVFQRAFGLWPRPVERTILYAVLRLLTAYVVHTKGRKILNMR